MFKEHKKNILIITILSILIMVVLSLDLKLLSHDMNFHLANIDNLKNYLDIFKGKILAPDIMPNIADNLGYGLYIFYPSLPHLIFASAFKILAIFGTDILLSNMIVNTFITIISSLLIYELMYKISKNKNMALISSITYIFFPYRLSCIFIRYSINETFISLFIPLILIALYELKEKNYKNFSIYFIIGYIGMIYSHLVMTLYLTIILIPFIFFYFKDLFNKKSLKYIIGSILFVSVFVMPNIINVLVHRDSNYLLDVNGYMTSVGLLEQNVMDFSRYFTLTSDKWDVQMFIPIMYIIGLLITLFYFIKEKKKVDKFYFFILSSLVISILITLPFFPWNSLPESLHMIQFPWRMMSFITVLISILVPFGLSKIKFKYTYIIYVVCLLLLLIPLINHFNSRYYKHEEIDYNLGVGNLKEYYPIEQYYSEEYYKNRNNDVILVTGEASIKQINTKFPNYKFEIENNKNARVEIPRLYYKGYEFKINGNKYEYHRSKNGLIEITCYENGLYEITYKGHIYKRIFVGIKYITLVIVIGFLIRRKYKQR
jgi:hypothetical protein